MSSSITFRKQIRRGDKLSSPSPPSVMVSFAVTVSSFSSFSFDGWAGKVDTRNCPNLGKQRIRYEQKIPAPTYINSPFARCARQRAKTLVSNCPGLVDFAIGLVNSVLDLPQRASEVFWGIQITEELLNPHQNFGIVGVTFGPLHA